MRCPIETQESSDILLAYCSRKLDPAGMAILEQHMEVCAACREFARGQRAVWEALDSWEALPVAPDFDRRLYRRIENEVSWWDLFLRPLRPFLVRQAVPVAAAAGLVIAAGLLIDRPVRISPNMVPETANELVDPGQAEHALQEMEMLQDFNRLAHADKADPRM